MKIKIANKYWLFKFNTEKNSIKKIGKSNGIRELKEQIVGKKIKNFESYEFVLIKLAKEPKFNPEDKSALAKLIGGPIKLTIKMYGITESGTLKPKYEKVLNKKGELDPDKRNAQYLYYTPEYYEANNIKSDDLKKVALLACANKLEKRPLAVKLITQIINK
jgi:hypothetical protein